MKKDLVIAKIVGTHGVRGTLKVLSFAQSESFFEADRKIRLASSSGIVGDYTVKWIKPHKRLFLMALEEITDMNAATALVGNEIFVGRGDFPPLPPGEFYWTDLIGLSVFTKVGEYIGRVESIFETGSNDVYVVKKGSSETLVPFIENVVKSVDLEGKTMLVELPEGLQ